MSGSRSKNYQEDPPSDQQQREPMRGICLGSTRRFAEIYCAHDQCTYHGVRGERSQDILPGDDVEFSFDRHSSSDVDAIVTHITERKNVLRRSYGRKTKVLSANVDELWIVTAPPPLLNTTSIDRMLVAARSEGIPCRILANKIDLDSNYLERISYYSDICVAVMPCSAKTLDGVDDLKEILAGSGTTRITITGMSGVGKSSLTRVLLGNNAIRTGDVSKKTGQGKQTTSATQGYVYTTDEYDHISVLFDLPGIQSFGVCHITEQELQQMMPDIAAIAPSCKFRNCSHENEPGCAVREAVSAGTITESRVQSYSEMRAEIREHNAF